MKRTRYVIYFILFLAVLSCDSQFIDEENKLQQENIEALTKSVPVVCVDLYVRWDDTDIYLGTACNSAAGGGGSGSITGGYDPDDIIESPPYTPGRIPDLPSTGGGGSSGGGTTHYNPSTGKQEYVFTNLKQIYDIGSTLDLVQKDKLDKLIAYLLSTGKNRELFDYMVAKNVKIKFHCNPNAEKIKIAGYDPNTKSIIIKDLDDFRVHQLQEELVHSVQHQCFYGNQMLLPETKIRKNCEFEAKVYNDLFSAINGITENYIACATDSRSEFKKAYKDWLDNMVGGQYGRFTDTYGFNRLCEMWIGYSGTYSSSFKPSLLLYFYRKPTPPDNRISINKQ